MMFALLY